MAKKSTLERNTKRIILNKKYSKKYNTLKYKYSNAVNKEMKLELHLEIQKIPRNSLKTRIKNRCWRTGRSRGYYRDFGLSRHSFRELAHQCLLPGITKSSW
jgi:small subunit ribosomal protein S14